MNSKTTQKTIPSARLEKTGFLPPFLAGFIQKQKKVAIEIGSHWVKVGEFSWGQGGYAPSQFKAERTLDIKDDLSSGIKRLLKEMDIKEKSAVLIIPRYFITIRHLELPSIDQNEIAEIIDLQVSKQTPYSREEIIFGFEPTKDIKEGYSKVLLAITKKNIVEERLKVLKEAGLEISSIRISSEMAYQNFLLLNRYKGRETKTTLLIDIDGHFSDILIINEGKLVFTRNIFIGRDFISKNPDDWKNKFTEEINRSLELYRHEGYKNIDKIEFSGAVNGLADLSEFASASFNLPVNVINPSDTRPSGDRSAYEASLFPNALRSSLGEITNSVSLSALLGALCSRQEPHIDLLPQEIKIERQMKYKVKNITHTGVLAISILILLSAFLLKRFYSEKHYHDRLYDKFIKTEKETAVVERMKVKISTIRQYLDKKNSVINILQELFRVTPESIHFSSINYTKNKEVVLTGTSEAMSDVFRFVTILEELELFEKVKTNHATKKTKEEKEIADFELVCPLAE